MRSKRSWLLIGALLIGPGGCGSLISSHHDVSAYTPVFAAAEGCELPQLREAVEHDPRLLKAVEWDGATLLHDAVVHDCRDLVAYLLDKGANPNAAKSDGVRPLHLAAMRGDLPLIVLLLSHRARVNAVDAKGWTPLDRAEKWDHPEVAAYLRQHGGG